MLGVIDKSQLTNRSVTLGTPPPPIFILIYLFSGAPSGHHFSFSSTGACSKTFLLSTHQHTEAWIWPT